MNAFSYAKSTSRGKTRHRRRHRYYIINRKRFIYSQLILCILIVFMITMISNPTKKEVNRQEQKVSFNLTSAIKPEPKPEANLIPMHNLASEHIVFASGLKTIRNIPEAHISRGGIKMDTERYKDAPVETQAKSAATSNTDSAISKKERHLLEQLVEAEEKARQQAAQATKTSSKSISSEERDLLERLVEAEAGGEPYEGKLAVATVVMNRVNSSEFPNTVREVIYQKNQFSPVANGGLNRKASAETKKAVRKVVDEGYRSFSADVVYFLNPDIAASKWIVKNRTFVTTIGNHDFYE